MIAAEDGNVETVTVLLAAGAEVNHIAEDDGSNPLLQAAGEGHPEVVSVLLAAGATVVVVRCLASVSWELADS